MVNALDEDPGLSKISGYAADSGEGGGPSRPGSSTGRDPAITAALYARFVSEQDESPTMKAVAAMRRSSAATRCGRRPQGGDAEDRPEPSSRRRRRRRAGDGAEPTES